jgi:PepSY-associated TM region
MPKIMNGLWWTLVISHRYLGVAVGLLMLAWFVSGIVMMYVGFPQPAGNERLRGLPQIAWSNCCRVELATIPDTQPIGRAEIEMLLGAPVLRLPRVLLPVQTIDMVRGTERHLDIEEAKVVATAAAPHRNGKAAPLMNAEEIDEDQWTLNRYRQEQPIFRFGFGDPDRSVLYVSGASGRVVLRTTATQRFWNWLGAIPHWLYLEPLRTDPLLWTRVVIWTSILGSFLTIFGLYLGIAQFRRGKDGRVSPYRGLFYWHHLSGLVFGLIALAFVASGLVSMNPWGFLDSRGSGERARLDGQLPRWGDVKSSIMALGARSVTAVNLSLAPYGGNLFWFATGEDGSVTRLDASGNVVPIGEHDLVEAAARLAGSAGIAAQGFIKEGDAYYIGDRSSAPLPVYRVIANDAESTRYYLDPTSGALVQRADSNRRWHRWLFGAIHRLDFAAWIRVRPIWDIILVTLMIGGAAVSATGVYLALRRVRNDIVLVFRFLAKRSAALHRPRTRTT